MHVHHGVCTQVMHVSYQENKASELISAGFEHGSNRFVPLHNYTRSVAEVATNSSIISSQDQHLNLN